jgi:hypothetical protein
MIVGENIRLRLGATTHNRFLDRVEKRDGTWKIVNRQSIYDMGSITFPLGPVNVDAHQIAAHPGEYAAVAYLLELSGFPAAKVFATKGSDLEHDIKTAGATWLTS